MNLEIRKIQEDDINEFTEAMSCLPWHREPSIYHEYFKKQQDGKHEFIIAIYNNNFVGHVCLKWESRNKQFSQNQIPEISDLLVLQQYQRLGIASKLLAYCEKVTLQHDFKTIGLAVGLYEDYGPAQKLYMKLGYSLDGSGITYDFQKVIPGTMVKIDDELLIWLTKQL